MRNGSAFIVATVSLITTNTVSSFPAQSGVAIRLRCIGLTERPLPPSIITVLRLTGDDCSACRAGMGRGMSRDLNRGKTCHETQRHPDDGDLHRRLLGVHRAATGECYQRCGDQPRLNVVAHVPPRPSDRLSFDREALSGSDEQIFGADEQVAGRGARD